MVMKNPVRMEHLEAYRAGRFEEIPVDILPLVKEQEEARAALAPKKPASSAYVKPAKIEEKDLE